MRIAFVLGSTPPRHAGEEDLQALVEFKGDWLGDEAMAVAALGHEVSVHLMYPLRGEARHGGVEWFFRPPLFSLRMLRGGKEYAPALARSLEAWKPDLVHYQIISHALNYAYFAGRAARMGVPLVGQHHGDPISPFFWNNMALRRAAGRSEAVIFLTRHHRDLYCRKFRLPRGKTRVIPVGYNERFHPRDRAACREKTGLAGDPVLFWAAMLNKRKDPLTFLGAFRDVCGSFPRARLYMAGSGPIEEEVRRFVASDPLLSRAVSLLGYVDNRDLPEYLAAADIYVMASRWEGFAISSMEAMACGAFPVLTRIPCFREQTEEGRFGLLFEPGNRRDLAEKLTRAIGEGAWREEIRAALPGRISRFAWKVSAGKLVRLYDEILTGRLRRGGKDADNTEGLSASEERTRDE